MSSMKKAIPRRAHKERSQPESRKKFGLLEKHKDYVVRAKEYHRKQDTIKKLQNKAYFRNPDEFNFGMIKTKTVDGVHKEESEANKYTHDELMLMKTQDKSYVLQLLQREKNKIEKLASTLQSVDNQPLNNHVYFAEDREEAKEILAQHIKDKEAIAPNSIPKQITRKLVGAYKELDARKKRARDLEKVYTDMSMSQEIQKKGRKRKLREDEIVNPTSKPVFKWYAERKR